LSVRLGISSGDLRRETGMDSNFTIKPRPGVLPRSNALRDPVTVREASDTELAPARAVTPADQGGRHDNHSQSHEQPQHEVVIDPGVRDALFQAVDVRAGHDGQPNQALMRQRAYRSSASPNEPAAADNPHADIEA
jgi:hypothetical protein